MPDYSKGKIYTIRCRNDDTLIYVGSTIQPLSKRWGGHKEKSKSKRDRLIYSTIGDDWGNWYIELYQDYSCENKEQLLKKEGEVIREIGTLNVCIPNRTIQEWREDNNDKLKEYKKEYYQANAEKIKEKSKEYQKANADKKKVYNQEYLQANADKRKEYLKANADKIKEYQKEYRKKNKPLIV